MVLVKKYGLKAIIIPGLSIGIIIWTAFFISHSGMISTGTRADRAIFIEVFIAPFLLVIGGAVSEIFRRREQQSAWTPGIPFFTGFLGAGTATIMLFTGTAITQYLPLLEPGLVPRLTYIIGHVMMNMPIIIIVSIVYALFSLAGGYGMHWKMKREEERKNFQKNS